MLLIIDTNSLWSTIIWQAIIFDCVGRFVWKLENSFICSSEINSNCRNFQIHKIWPASSGPTWPHGSKVAQIQKHEIEVWSWKCPFKLISAREIHLWLWILKIVNISTPAVTPQVTRAVVKMPQLYSGYLWHHSRCLNIDNAQNSLL